MLVARQLLRVPHGFECRRRMPRHLGDNHSPLAPTFEPWSVPLILSRSCAAVADLLHGGAGRLSSGGWPAARHPIQLQCDPQPNHPALGAFLPRSSQPHQSRHRLIIVACAGLVSTFASGALDSALNSAGVSLVNIRRVMEGVACVIKAAGLVAFSQCRRPAYAV